MLIPWLISIPTKLMPDEICLKLISMTDTEVNTYWGPAKANEFAPPSKSFGGSVNFSSSSFRLVNNPHSLFTNLHYKIIYQGAVKVGGGQCRMEFWVRPSLAGLFYLFVWTWLSFMGVKQIVSGAWEGGWNIFAAIAVLGWGVATWNTYQEVSNARRRFMRILDEAEELRRERPRLRRE